MNLRAYPGVSPFRIRSTAASWTVWDTAALLILLSGLMQVVLALVLYSLLPTLAVYNALLLGCMGLACYFVGHGLLLVLPKKKRFSGVIVDQPYPVGGSNGRANGGTFVTFRQFSERLHKP